MLNRWFLLDDKIRFLFVGGFNFVVSYIIYSAVCLIFGNEFYQYSLAFTWAVTSVISFTTQKLLVFKGGDNWFKEYLKCCTTWIFSYFINAVLLEVLVKNIHLNVFISQLAANFTAAVFTYIVFKKFAFRETDS